MDDFSVHRKFSLYMIVNWRTLDFKTFLKHFLDRIKNILQQLQNKAKSEKAVTSKIQKYGSNDRQNQVYIKTSDTMTLDCRQAGRIMHEGQQI